MVVGERFELSNRGNTPISGFQDPRFQPLSHPAIKTICNPRWDSNPRDAILSTEYTDSALSTTQPRGLHIKVEDERIELSYAFTHLISSEDRYRSGQSSKLKR
jgi:hypothetical protein